MFCKCDLVRFCLVYFLSNPLTRPNVQHVCRGTIIRIMQSSVKSVLTAHRTHTHTHTTSTGWVQKLNLTQQLGYYKTTEMQCFKYFEQEHIEVFCFVLFFGLILSQFFTHPSLSMLNMGTPHTLQRTTAGCVQHLLDN